MHTEVLVPFVVCSQTSEYLCLAVTFHRQRSPSRKEQNIILSKKKTKESFIRRSCLECGQCKWGGCGPVTGSCSLLMGIRCHDPAKSLSALQCLHHCAKRSSEITASSGCSEKYCPGYFVTVFCIWNLKST